MNRELLKEIAEVFRERRGGIAWVAEPLLGKIEAELSKPDPEPVAWLSDRGTIWHDKQDAVDDSDGFVEPLYTAPPDQLTRIAELEKYAMENSISAYRDSNNRLTDQIEQLEQQLAALQATREPLSDDEIRDCAESENLPYFENKEEFDAFARAIEAAHGIVGVNNE